MKKTVFFTFAMVLFATLLFTSCSNDPIPPKPPIGETIKVPPTYDFLRDNKTSVIYLDQTNLSKMAGELVDALKNKPNGITEAKLNAMFDHKTNDADFKDATLNASAGNLKNSVATDNNITDRIEEQATVVFPVWEQNAEKGKAGQLKRISKGDFRHFDAKGLELHEAVEKEFIGGLSANTITMSLSKDKLDAGANKADNNASKVVSGKNYTAMEHLWDEAYGALYTASGDKGNPIKSKEEGAFLSEYIGRIDKLPAFKGIAKTILDAFKLGRAAIVEKNYTVRDAQAKIIIDNVAKVMAVRCVFYLQGAKSSLTNDKASAFHELSEGSGFIRALRFAQTNATKQFPAGELDGLYNSLTGSEGLWVITAKKIDAVSLKIAMVYGFTIPQATTE